MHRTEYELLGALRANVGYDVPSVLARSGGTQVFSFGGGTGVRMGNHGFAWIGLVAGRKVWYVAPVSIPRPANPTCTTGDSVEQLPGVSHCLQRPREVMVVPTAWWHATCNLEPYTFGIGGQDSCDLVLCPGFENAHHMHKQFCPIGRARSAYCFSSAGTQSEGDSFAQSLRAEAAARAGDEAWEAYLEEGGPERRKLDARFTRSM